MTIKHDFGESRDGSCKSDCFFEYTDHEDKAALGILEVSSILETPWDSWESNMLCLE